MNGTVTIRRKGEDPRYVMMEDIPKGSAFLYNGQTYLYPHQLGGLVGRPSQFGTDPERVVAVRCVPDGDMTLVAIRKAALVVPTDCSLNFAG